MRRETKNMLTKIGLIALALIAGFIIGRTSQKNTILPEQGIEYKRQNNSKFSYTNPLIGVEIPGEKLQFREYSELEKKVNQVFSDAKLNNNLISGSLYFRDTKNGRWVAINEKEQYAPGSLLKVPLMIALYKEAEIDPSFLSKTLTYSGGSDSNLNEKIKPQKFIEPYKSYTLSELIHYMIVYSDNNATNLLYDNINHEVLNQVYSDLGIDFNETNAINDSITAREYSLFFRILYNATYLSTQYSEQALNLLSQTEFSEGLVAGLPNNTKAAHKFGEREVLVKNEKVAELHDCGIVYVSNNTYIACIMTKGKSLDKLKDVVRDVSKEIYENLK